MKKIIWHLIVLFSFCVLPYAHGNDYYGNIQVPITNQRNGGRFISTPTISYGQPVINAGNPSYNFKSTSNRYAGYRNTSFKNTGYRPGGERTSLNYTPLSPNKTFTGTGNSLPVISAQSVVSNSNYNVNKHVKRYSTPSFNILQPKSLRAKRIANSMYYGVLNNGSTRHNAPEIDDQWREQFYAEMGRYPYSDQELQDYINNKQGSGIFGPGNNNDDPGGGGTTIPTINDQWREEFYAEFGRYPSSDQELQDYINWKLGMGIFNPTPEDDPGGGSTIPTIYEQWMAEFFAEFGRYPNSEKELQDYINWKLGIGVFNPSPIPVGDIPWLMIILLLAMTVVYKTIIIKQKKAIKI